MNDAVSIDDLVQIQNTIQAIPNSMVTEGVHTVQLLTRSLRKIFDLGVKIYKFIKVLRVAELC